MKAEKPEEKTEKENEAPKTEGLADVGKQWENVERWDKVKKLQKGTKGPKWRIKDSL